MSSTAPIRMSIQWISGTVHVEYHGNDLTMTVQGYDSNDQPCFLTIGQPSIVQLRDLLDQATESLLLGAIDKSDFHELTIHIPDNEEFIA